MEEPSTKGASRNEQLIAAARDDNEELMVEILEHDDFDINYHDGLGNTALHYASQLGNLDVLEHILSHDDCDVDPINRLDKATPLHLAVKIDDEELREKVVESLLEAGADTYIKNKYGETALDLVSTDNIAIRGLFSKLRASASISQDDVASDDDDEEGSGSGSDDD